ncbi:MAG: UDP-N-acetylmuramoyl-L-alanyl-D-glutamate--2,6-diaminopimelate ligase [Treponema sp.]|jgi:UDP-N-acetylmuramoyl-L-alanyl-D-glutamate--2,6-diaminopimelate ligase|nr:UDP-N-acetylmuramoyl-L-alanyl-D-glutamate--2,6-diaminopimelate ligase [Treponema sp.]
MTRQLLDFITKEITEKSGIITMDEKLNPEITGLEYDSRNVKSGNLFFALPGLHTDGCLFINDAIKNGAAAVVYENDNVKQNQDITYIKVKNARYAMSPISASFYGFPSRRLLITGVTGTEGKSTTVYLIWQLLTLMGKKAGFISTVQHCMGGEVLWNSEHQTTPEASIVQRQLYEMADNGCEYVVLESSSHGLSPKTNRLGDVDFCSGVLTNIAHEHLEFHGTWEQYRDDKTNLFRIVNRYTPPQEILNKHSFFEPFVVLNSDDKSSEYITSQIQIKTLFYDPSGKSGNLLLESIESQTQGSNYTVFIPELNEHLQIKDNLPGAYNSFNVMAAILTVSGLLNLPLRQIVPFVENLKPVKGRMTTINKGQPFEVVVDYAHTPSSFQTIFPPLYNRIRKNSGRIISLFGSPGERDTKKRYEQGKIAASYSDIVILTDEDPRGENPMAILEEIVKGCEAGWSSLASQNHEEKKNDLIRGENLFLIPDRPLAIRKAFSLAQKGDIVLLLGKGHENSIIYADHVKPFDEIVEAEKALEEKNF